MVTQILELKVNGQHRGDVVVVEPLERREELVRGSHSFADVTNMVCRPTERSFREMHIGWRVGFFVAATLLAMFLGGIAWLVWTGIGIWGNTSPVYWAWDIVNFVFWVGIGHAGTLISAILFLFRQKWRTSINRYAEAMTIFAVICALVFPAVHVGRIWTVYWMFPLFNQMDMWPNFRSPLLWDVFAVGTYFTISLMFWWVGLIPDFATLRDRAQSKARKIGYGLFAM